MEQYTNLTGDGTTKTFYFTFPFFGVNDIHVKVNDVEQTTDNYTLTPTQTPNDADTEYTGGSIEFTTAPANDSTVTIYREIDLVRHIDYQPTEKPLSHQLNQDFNQCIGALREFKIKLQNTLNLATIPTLSDLLAELTTIRTALPDLLDQDDLDTLNDTIDDIQDAITTLNGYDYVIESQLPTADNNYTWYRKYKSGWVEQGGITTAQTINLPITMADANYHVLLTGTCNASNNNVRIVGFRDRTTSSFFVQVNVVNQNSQSSASNNSDKIWEVKGMAA